MLNLEGAIRFALGYAQRQERIVYIYSGKDGKPFVSLNYNGDYLVKVYPGGNRVFSLFGLKVAERWIDGIALG